jgi:hypothetical protein
MGVTDVTIEIIYYSLSALVNLRKKRMEQCWIFAESVFNLLMTMEPTHFITYTGYTILPEIYFRILQDPKSWTELSLTLSKSKVTTKLEKSLQYLQKFSETFPFAKASLEIWSGCLRFASKNMKKATAMWTQALETAKSAGMKYEEALVLYNRGVLTKNHEDIVAACTLFPEIKTRAVDISGLKLKHHKLLLGESSEH